MLGHMEHLIDRPIYPWTLLLAIVMKWYLRLETARWLWL